MSDRFHIIPANRLPAPSKCWCCGSSSRPCVDWGSDIQFMGAVLLCITCLAEAAALLAPAIDHEKKNLENQVAIYERAIRDFRSAIDTALGDVAIARGVDISGDATANEFLAKAGR